MHLNLSPSISSLESGLIKKTPEELIKMDKGRE